MSSGASGILRFRAVLPACIVFAIALAMLWLSMDHDVGFWDTGEMQTVPYILGLAHSTGYPTEILLGWIFAHVVPIGSPAERLNFFCVLCVATTAAVCCQLAVKLGSSRTIAIASALCFVATPVVWLHADHMDVTDPALMLCALTLLCVAMGVEHPNWYFAAAVFAGLALGTHGIVIWFLPAAIVMLIASRAKMWPIVTGRFVAIAAGVAVALYCYLPIRSAQVTAERLDPTGSIGLPSGMPIWDLGHPATLHGFLSVVTGSAVDATGSLGAAARLQGGPQIVIFSARQLHLNYSVGVLLVMLALIAFAIYWKREFCLLLLPFVLLMPFAASFIGESDVSRYYTLPICCLWVLVSLGATFAVRGNRRYDTAITAFLGGYFVYQVFVGRGLFYNGADHLGRTYIDTVIRLTANDSIIVAPWVYMTPLAYQAYVEHAVGGRIIVPMAIEDSSPYLAGWLAERHVYAVSEAQPQGGIAARLVEPLHVNPDSAHDPKLYAIYGHANEAHAPESK